MNRWDLKKLFSDLNFCLQTSKKRLPEVHSCLIKNGPLAHRAGEGGGGALAFHELAEAWLLLQLAVV